VLAGLVRETWEYEYSSARFYCLGREDGITQVSPDYEDFGKEVVGRQAAYKKFLSIFDNEEENYFTNTEIPRVDRDFLRRLVKKGGHYLPRRRGRKAAFVS